MVKSTFVGSYGGSADWIPGSAATRQPQNDFFKLNHSCFVRLLPPARLSGYSYRMIFDIENARAGYVIAAYAVAAAGLLGLLFASWRMLRRWQAEWDRLRGKQSESKP